MCRDPQAYVHEISELLEYLQINSGGEMETLARDHWEENPAEDRRILRWVYVVLLVYSGGLVGLGYALGAYMRG